MHEEVIKRIDAYAIANYDDGWAGWIETMSTEDKIGVFKDAKDYDTCYHRVVLWVADYAQSDAIKAECCALYEESPDFYKKIQNNNTTCQATAEKSRAALDELEKLQYEEEAKAEEAMEDPERYIRYKPITR